MDMSNKATRQLTKMIHIFLLAVVVFIATHSTTRTGALVSSFKLDLMSTTNKYMTCRHYQEGRSSLVQLKATDNNNNNNINNNDRSIKSNQTSRRQLFKQTVVSAGAGVAFLAGPNSAFAVDEGGLNVDDFLKTGMVSQPMGVSGQAGKSRPETGVVLRDGSEVIRDKSSGGVLAEILVDGSTQNPVVVSFSSPWPVATGSVFDVECRNANTGDGAFLTVSSATNGNIEDLSKTFFSNELFQSSGRFSFYGSPTDIKFKKSRVIENNGQLYKYMDLSFSNLSQSTNAEIPRNAVVAATIPKGTNSVVMLVGSSSASRWKSSERDIRETVESFRAAPAPKTSLKVRAASGKERFPRVRDDENSE